MPPKMSSLLIADIHDGNVIVAYQGIFDISILTILAQNIETNVNTNERLKKKLFKIFLELAQNVSLYSLERQKLGEHDMGQGIFIIKESDDYFTIATGNMASNEVVGNIVSHISKINSLERDDLRKYKRERRALPQGVKGGANIGLIQVSLTSENHLEYLVGEQFNDRKFIAIATKINK
ncbi:MAG: SiaB family protein kinase [Bacteroidales bacterium]|nr:SiaB family protein kinase [Bacteroidales bacterium]